jgi:putative transposase
VLSNLAYLTLCRSIQLLALLARGPPPRTWRSSSWATNSPCSAAKSHVPSSNPPTAPCSPAVSRVLPRPRWSCFLVQPETLLGWHRRPVAGAWTYPHRHTGRPPLNPEVQQLIVRLAKENPTWGYQQIKASSNGLACASPRPRSAPRCAATDWIQRHGGRL